MIMTMAGEKLPPKKKRVRRRSTDSVYLDKAKGKWVAQITIGAHANGRPKYSRRFFPTRAEAEVGVAELHMQNKSGRLVTTKALTLGGWLDQWLTIHSNKVSANTLRFYKGAIEAHIKPNLGIRQLSKLQPGEIESLCRKLEEKGLRRIPYAVHQTLRKSLKKAVAVGLIGVSPMEKVEAPRQPERVEKFLTMEQINKFIEASKAAPTEVAAVALLGIKTGARLAELLGVQWDDIDFDDGNVLFRSQLMVRGGLRLAPLKTQSSIRKIFFPEIAKEALLAEKNRQEQFGFQHPLGLAFLNSEGRHWHQKNINDGLKEICRSADIPEYSAHALFRHSYATLLLKAGVSGHDASKMLGHKNKRLTEDLYGHHEVEASRRAAKLAEDALLTQLRHKVNRPKHKSTN